MEAAATLRDDSGRQDVLPVPSFNDLVVRAAALALRDFPALNASYAPGKSIQHERINIGVAVDAPEALLVPTIHDADRKPSVHRGRVATPRGSSAGTPSHTGRPRRRHFTVSNLGMFGVRRFHAVINPPQVALLAVGDVAPRPFVAEDRSNRRATVDGRNALL